VISFRAPDGYRTSCICGWNATGSYTDRVEANRRFDAHRLAQDRPSRERT
jgi:hypothetical protein